jgi:hypothetical protein
MHARARARVAPPSRVAPLGQATRNAIDDQQANTVRKLAIAIKPGVTLRLERTRPTWCAGFLEDYPVEDQGESLNTLREHLRDEHGGQRYRVTVLQGDNVLAEGPIMIAGQPREHGRVINRAKWEGWADEDQRPSAAAAPSNRGELGTLAELIRLFADMQRDSAKAQLESVRDMVTQTRAQTTDLIREVVRVREVGTTQRSFTAQLGEIVEATRGIDKVKRQLFGAAKPEREAPEPDDDQILDREAKRYFMRNVMASMFKPDRASQQPAQQNNVRPIHTAPRGARIPDAGAPPRQKS